MANSKGYKFVLNQWVIRAYTVDNVMACVTKKFITSEEAQTILNTPQIEV